MSKPRGRTTLAHVFRHGYVQVVIDLDTDGDQIQGSLTPAGEDRKHFYGWLQLASHLERIRKHLPTIGGCPERQDK